MIILKTIEDEFVKLENGKPVFLKPTMSKSEDGLTITVISKSKDELENEGFKTFKVETVGKPGTGKRPFETWSEVEGQIIKTVEWKEILKKGE